MLLVMVPCREKDLVNRGGEKVSCAEVEGAVLEHPAVLEAAVFAVPDTRLGEEVRALVTPLPLRLPIPCIPRAHALLLLGVCLHPCPRCLCTSLSAPIPLARRHTM